MRFLTSLILLFAFGAQAALPPTTIKGQADSAKSVTFDLSVPYKQSTRLSGTGALIETGNGNTLANPSFEGSAIGSSWSTGVGAVASLDSTNFSQGTKSALFTLTATNGTITNQTPTSPLLKTNYDAGAWIKTSLSNVQVCGTLNSVEMQCVAVIGDNDWHYTYVIFGSDGTRYPGLLIKTTSAATGTVNVDAAYVGLTQNIGTIQSPEVGTVFYTRSASCPAGSEAADGGTTSSGALIALLGSSTRPDLRGVFARGAGTNATTLNGKTVAGGTVGALTGDATSKNGLGISDPGHYHYSGLNADANTSLFGTTSQGATTLFDNSGYYGAGSTHYNSSSSTTGVSITAGDAETKPASVALTACIQSTSTGQTVTNATTAPWFVGAYLPTFPGSTTTTASYDMTTTAVAVSAATGSEPIGAACPSGQASVIGNLSCSSGTTSNGFTFNAKTVGPVLVCSSIVESMDIASSSDGTALFNVVETTGTSTTTIGAMGSMDWRWSQYGAASSNNRTHTMSDCQVYNFTTTGQKIIRVKQSVTVSSGSITSNIAYGAHITIVPINQAITKPLLVGGVTSSSSGTERVERLRITGGGLTTNCTTTPCTIDTQSGSWVSSITRIGAGQYTVNVAVPFGNIPVCTCNAVDNVSAGAAVNCSANATSTSSISVTAVRMSTVGLIDAVAQVLCQGSK